MIEPIDPISLPLWATLLFAASMYPLGFLMPGCVCCQSGACTECGSLTAGYVSSQGQFGRMCCNGTVATSVTVRVTNLGPSSSTVSVRGTGSSYTKITKTFPCSSLGGDYVIPLSRLVLFSAFADCRWALKFAGSWSFTNDIEFLPVTNGSFPNWTLLLNFFQLYASVTKANDSCSGYPGIETCTRVSTTTSTEQLYLARPVGWSANNFNAVAGINFTSQRCSPSGLVFVSSGELLNSDYAPYGTDRGTGCQIKVELV